MDDIFSKPIPEWYDGQEVSSAHDESSFKPFTVADTYMLFAYPRDDTPVCTSELIELAQRLSEFPEGLEVYAASTDSPETHNRFFNDPEAFNPQEVANVEYPAFTIREQWLTDVGRTHLINEFGYCNRVALFVAKGKLVASYRTPDMFNRDMNTIINLALQTKDISQKVPLEKLK